MPYLDIHTHQSLQQKDVKSILSLSLTDGNLYPLISDRPISVGLHPWFAKFENLEFQLKHLECKAQQTNVKMIGECGLDKSRGESISNQIIILENQIKLAEKLNKPIILHCVKSFSELLEVKKRLKVNIPMVIHGFNKHRELGEQLIANGFYLSFGASVLKENSNAAQLVQSTDNFFLETDDSKISIQQIYEVASNLKKCSVDELKARIFSDWERFNLL